MATSAVLVGYATRNESAKEVAERIASCMKGNGLNVDPTKLLSR